MEWINAPGAWTFIVALIILGWLLASLFVDSGLAWTFVHLGHGVITYYLLHWNKGSPVQMDQVRLTRLSSGGAAASITTETHSRSCHPGLAVSSNLSCKQRLAWAIAQECILQNGLPDVAVMMTG